MNKEYLVGAIKGLLYHTLGAKYFAKLQAFYWVYKLRYTTYDNDHFFLLRQILPPDAVCIDIGANIGQYSTQLSRIVSRGVVFALEPVPDTQFILQQVLQGSGCTNVTVLPYGASDKTHTCIMHTPKDRWGVPQLGLSYSTKNTDGQTLDMRPLDSLSLPPAQFVKIDVEGYEWYVLSGAKVYLQHNHPLLLIELDHTMSQRAGIAVSETLDLLRNLGYRMVRLISGQWVSEKSPIISGQMYWFCADPDTTES